MADTITKGLMGRGDLSLYDGVSSTTTRSDGAGSTVTINKINDAVDVLQVYGSGTNRTSAALQTALDAVGSSNVALACAVGTWSISANVTVPANVTLVVPAGCVFSVDNGITLTINGVLFRQHATYSSGDGTVTVNGTDILSGPGYTSGYAADTGTANTYAIAPSPAISAYSAGQTFRWKVGNTNTGASTLAVSGLAAKAIVRADGSTALSSGDLTAGQIVQVMYESSDDEFHLVPTQQSAATSLDISGTTATTTLDPDDDLLLVYDESAAANRSAKLGVLTQELLPDHWGVLAPHKNLTIAVGTTPARHSTVTADQIVVTNGTDQMLLESVTVTDVDVDGAAGAGGIDTGSSANSTWYHLWVIWGDGQSTSAVWSTQTARASVTMPSNYTHAAYVGARYNDSGGDFLTSTQVGSLCAVEAVQELSSGSATSFTSVTVTAPTTARRVGGYASILDVTGGALGRLWISPDDDAGNVGGQILGSEVTSGPGAWGCWQCALMTDQTVYYKVEAGTEDADIYTSWWEF